MIPCSLSLYLYLAFSLGDPVNYGYYKEETIIQYLFDPQDFHHLDLENDEENYDLCEALEKSLEEIDAKTVSVLEAKPFIGECNTDQLWIKISELSIPEKKEEVLWTGYLARFGHSSLKQFQKDAIQAVQQARDTIIIQPTASGKSICFQIPAL